MEKQYFIQLLHKYFRSDLTEEEREYIEKYYELFRNEPDILDTLSAEEKNTLKHEIKGSVWDAIVFRERTRHKRRLIQKRSMLSAAAAVIAVILTIGIFFQYGRSPKKEVASNQITPPKKTRSDVQEENRLIFLPDGSRVIVNSGSRLNYPSSFDGRKTREVYLEGQAFFDIQHNDKKPFIVHTGNLQTVVLGTAFNIKAIPGDKEITVTVTRGKVKVKDERRVLGIITPNQEIRYDRQKEIAVMKTVKDDHYLDWKNNELLFDNVTVAEAAKMLEEEYNVTIMINDSAIHSQRFTTTFPKNENLDQALKSICEFNGVTYRYDNTNNATVIIIDGPENK
jgi:ferric-dicitrate binding protein FerR (iron transport regulator)